MSAKTRRETGQQTFEAVLGFPVPTVTTPLTEAVQDFVFAEVWNRPGLDRRSRRWITLACVAAAGTSTAMRTHALAAITSGDISMAELREFVLQFGVFQGFPKAVEFEAILNAIDVPGATAT
jgi:4-carboxymuconolactone decarboxylase